VVERHHHGRESLLLQSALDALASLRREHEEKETTAAGPGDLSSVHAKVARQGIPTIDLRGGDARGKSSLELPALIEEPAKLRQIARLQGLGHIVGNSLDGVQALDDLLISARCLSLRPQNSG